MFWRQASSADACRCAAAPAASAGGGRTGCWCGPWHVPHCSGPAAGEPAGRSIKLVFVIAAVYDLGDFIVDIKGAYLNASKPEGGTGSNTYIYQPPGFEEYGPNGEKMVGLLNYYVYGDPAAGRAWWAEFQSFLTSAAIGTRFTDVDVNLGRIDHALGYIIFAKYVDELVGAGSTPEVIEWLRSTVDAKYPGCTYGPWDTVLGFGVSRDRANRTVSVNSAKLINDLMKRGDVEVEEK